MMMNMNQYFLSSLLFLLIGCAYIPVSNPTDSFFQQQWKAVLQCKNHVGDLPMPNIVMNVEGGFPRCEESTSGAVGCTTVDIGRVRGDVIEINPETHVTIGKEVFNIKWNTERVLGIIAFASGRISQHLTRHELLHWYYFLVYGDVDGQHKRSYECAG